MPRNHYFDRTKAKSSPPKAHNKVQYLTPFERKLVNWGNRKIELQGTKGMLLEGEKLLTEAVDINYPLHTVWHSEEFAGRNRGLISTLENTETELKTVNNRTIKEISDLDSPQGIVAVAPQPNFTFRQPDSPFSLIVALPKIQNPVNLGGMIRTADYFGVDELWLGQESADPYKPKVVRGSMGSIFRLPIVRVASISEKLTVFKEEGATVLAAIAHGKNAAPVIPASGSRILLIGEESKGLSTEMVKLADKSLKIPGAGRSESLNLATATGILIYLATTGRMEEI